MDKFCIYLSLFCNSISLHGPYSHYYLLYDNFRVYNLISVLFECTEREVYEVVDKLLYKLTNIHNRLDNFTRTFLQIVPVPVQAINQTQLKWLLFILNFMQIYETFI